MPEYSTSKPSVYAGLRFRNISVLLGILRKLALMSPDYVKQRFLETATNFDVTLDFLEKSGLVMQTAGRVGLRPSLPIVLDVGDNAFPRQLLSVIAGQDSVYRSELWEYLRRFAVEADTAVHRPLVEQRSSESAIRNFLMELGLVTHDKANDLYALSRDTLAVYAQSICSSAEVTPACFAARQRGKEDVGLVAELAVFADELRRVGSEFANQVEHTALSNVAAGFDIRSVSFCEDRTAVPRFIEVKAVPSITYRFYWSANERNVARAFGAWYYLYLVPITMGGVPCILDMRIVPNPFSAILSGDSEWAVESDVLECSLPGDTLPVSN